VNGSAYGFATELLYFFDQVIAVRGSEFSLPGIRYGLVPVTTDEGNMFAITFYSAYLA
jgi:enoyl-CoA hydratase/carnithine racemase